MSEYSWLVSCPTQSKVKFSPQLHAGFCILTFTWQTRRLSVWVGLLVCRKKRKCKRLGNSKAKKNDKIQKQTLRKFSGLITMFYHFTVIYSVTWPWNGSETAGDLVLIQTFSYYFCINQVVLMLTTVQCRCIYVTEAEWSVLKQGHLQPCCCSRPGHPANNCKNGLLIRYFLVKWQLSYRWVS